MDQRGDNRQATVGDKHPVLSGDFNSLMERPWGIAVHAVPRCCYEKHLLIHSHLNGQFQHAGLGSKEAMLTFSHVLQTMRSDISILSSKVARYVPSVPEAFLTWPRIPDTVWTFAPAGTSRTHSPHSDPSLTGRHGSTAKLQIRPQA